MQSCATYRDSFGDESGFLTWNPNFEGTPPPGLEVEDMRKGLNSDRFFASAKAYMDSECQGIQDANSEETRTAQQKLVNRWTIHPAVDGCDPDEPPPNGNGPR